MQKPLATTRRAFLARAAAASAVLLVGCAAPPRASAVIGAGDAAARARAVGRGGDQLVQAPDAPAPPSAAKASPRRVGIQAGHWLVKQAPDELSAFRGNTGAESAGAREVDVNLDIARRVRDVLAAHEVVVDVLPVTIPPGYLADAFISLHMDSDTRGVKSGFKSAYSAGRSPLDQSLQEHVNRSYGAATGLAYDTIGITANMTSYYAMNWRRFRHTTSPSTPSLILEMGFVSNANDRALMLRRPELVARAIADGILRFIAEHPREKILGAGA